jgi:hypothetical protein
MQARRYGKVLHTALGAALFAAAAPAPAQLGFYQLPKDDFVWNWGNTREDVQRGFADLDLQGNEAGFRCELTARLRASGTLSQPEIRQLENDLRARLDFIYAASEAMSYLERMSSLDWGRLDCKKPGAAVTDEEESAERESRARDKMQREIERRRARQRDSD